MSVNSHPFRFASVALLVAAAALLGACDSGTLSSSDNGIAAATTEKATDDRNEVYSPKLVENRLVYEQDEPDSIVDLYLTLTPDNTTSDSPISWSELNKITYSQPEGNPKMSVIFQEGDENGPKPGMFGFGESYPNGNITLRGKSTMDASQKSYKIKLLDNTGRWRDQKTINLIKHAFDYSRIRNRLSFDYFKQIPDFTSLRTQFVHLFVKDLSEGQETGRFVDYGLYEQLEQPNKSFLRLHGLDPYGQLYKASNFEFLRYPDKLKPETAPDYDEKAFESVLEIKGSEDHTKLLNMLDAVNDSQQDIDDVLDRYFDRDNFMTWLAVNILMDNMDTNSQNFFLYSPLNSNKWFFLPWDYDGAWGYYEQTPGEAGSRREWQVGLQNYWGSKLQQRVFRNPKDVEELTAKIDELSGIINADHSRQMIDGYKKIVEPFVRSMPDIQFLNGPLSGYDNELERIINMPEENKNRYLNSLQKPMPFFMSDPKRAAEGYSFEWDSSFDLQGDELSYTFELAKDPAFAHPIEVRQGLTQLSITIDKPLKGHYFWRVRVTDAKGNEMSAFDDYEDTEGNHYDGVKEFYAL